MIAKYAKKEIKNLLTGGVKKMSNVNVNLPEELHKKLKMKSAEKGLYLKDYIISLLEKNG